MEWNGLTELPKFMTPLINTPFAVLCALVIPRSSPSSSGSSPSSGTIYGVYCAVITLAEVSDPAGFHRRVPGLHRRLQWHHRLFELCGAPFLWFILAVTVGFFVRRARLTHSRVGTVLKSIRDNDVRAEFMGYNVANYRIFVFCISAFMSAAAGAMYAAWVGLISFLDAGPVFSVEA